jgi:hypothetical protein
VPFHGRRAQVQLSGDLLVAHPRGEQPQHLGLAGGQPAGQRPGDRCARLCQHRADLGQPLRVAKLRGQRLGRPQVPGGLVGPAELVAGPAQPGHRLHRVVAVADFQVGGHRRAVVRGRVGPAPLVGRDVALVGADGPDQLRDAEVGGQRRRLGEGQAGLAPMAGPGQQVAQVDQADRDRVMFAQLALDRQRPFE